jgi:hypothetical protein
MTEGIHSPQIRRLWTCAAIASVAGALCWPAILNGFPLLFPDTLGYFRQSRGIVLKLRGYDMPYWSYEIMRSEIYSASMRFLHPAGNLWPLVAIQALLTAWMLWLVIRSLGLARALTAYLVIGLGLAAFSGIAWYVASPMPDILGPLLYLALFLFLLAPGSLGRWERWVLIAVALWSVTAHSVHLLLAGAVWLFFVGLWAAGWPGMKLLGRRLVFVAGLLAIAVLAQLAVHRRLYHEASLFGRPPAFLMARLIGDGPARTYLQQNCSGSPWLICRHANELPTDAEEFLWTNSITQKATPDELKELRREEFPLLIATLRTYPREQIAKSLDNFGRMLVTMGPWDYWNLPAYTPGYLDFSVPGLSARYLHTLQATNKLPQLFWRNLQPPLVAASLVTVLLFFPWMLRSRQYALVGLTAVILFTVLGNAFLNGVLSGVFPRYQGRVAWMVPFLAGILLYARCQQRSAPALENELAG